MAATFGGRLRRIELLEHVAVETLRPCREPRWQYAETTNRCFVNPRGSAGRAELDTALDREIHFPTSSAQSACVRRTRLLNVQIHPRKLRRPKPSGM